MKNIIFLAILIINTHFLFSQKRENNMDTIKIAENLILYVQKETKNNLINWSLILKSNNQNETIINKKIDNNNSSNTFLKSSKDYFLDVPKLVDGFSYGNKIYFYVFIERGLWLYRLDSKNKDISRIKIMEMIPGSVENFGDVNFQIERCDYKDESYFSIVQSRVGGQIYKIIGLEKNKFIVKDISFTNKKNIAPKEEHDIFYNIDLANEQSKIKDKLRKILEKEVKNDFYYVGNLNAKEGVYLLCIIDKNINFILFTNDYEWQSLTYYQNVLK